MSVPLSGTSFINHPSTLKTPRTTTKMLIPCIICSHLLSKSIEKKEHESLKEQESGFGNRSAHPKLTGMDCACLTTRLMRPRTSIERSICVTSNRVIKWSLTILKLRSRRGSWERHCQVLALADANHFILDPRGSWLTSHRGFLQTSPWYLSVEALDQSHF